MSKVIKYKGLWLLLMAIVAVVGCNKTLVKEPGEAMVNFIVDWSNIKSGVPIPNDAVIYLYPKLGGDPIVSRATTTTKAQFKVLAGTYRIIMYNSDLSNLKLANATSYNDFLGYLEPVAKSWIGPKSKQGGGMIVPQTDYLHLLTGSSSKEIEVVENSPLELTLRPRTATNTLKLNVEVRSPREYKSVYARMSGVATRIELFSAKALGGNISNVEIPMNFIPSADKKMLAGQVEIIGIDPVNRNPGSNVLEMVLSPVQTGDVVVPDEVVSKDLTDALKDYQNMSIVVEIIIKPDPENPDKLIMEFEIRPWEVDPPYDLDVVPTE